MQSIQKRSTKKGTPFFVCTLKVSALSLWSQIAISLIAMISIYGAGAIAQEEMPTEPDSMVYSKSAAERGKSYYLINCQQCHDADGRALANIDFIAADLTSPDTWYYGASPLHIFRSIKFGAGLEMPPFKDSLEDEIIWQIVAHLLNIGPRESRPTQE